jgi:hypothetical protein
LGNAFNCIIKYLYYSVCPAKRWIYAGKCVCVVYLVINGKKGREARHLHNVELRKNL